jgi:hypothetical protein
MVEMMSCLKDWESGSLVMVMCSTMWRKTKALELAFEDMYLDEDAGAQAQAG